MYFHADIAEVEPEGLGAIEEATRRWQQDKDLVAGAFWDELHHEAYKELERRNVKQSRYFSDGIQPIWCAMPHEELTPKARESILKRTDDMRIWWAGLHRSGTAFFLARLLDACEKAFQTTEDEVTL